MANRDGGLERIHLTGYDCVDPEYLYPSHDSTRRVIWAYQCHIAASIHENVSWLPIDAAGHNNFFIAWQKKGHVLTICCVLETKTHPQHANSETFQEPSLSIIPVAGRWYRCYRHIRFSGGGEGA